jgi:Ctr copper transporter family
MTMMMLHHILVLVLFVHAFRLAVCFPFLVDGLQQQQHEDDTVGSENAATATRGRSHHTAADDSSSSIFATEVTARMEELLDGHHDHLASTQDSENVPVLQQKSPADSVNSGDNSSDDSDDDQLPFCSGMPMSMFMDGFHWSLWRSHNDTTNNSTAATTTKPPRCLVYFVSSWELSQEGKFKGAMVFSFLMGLLMEGLSAMRAAVSRQGEKSSSRRRRNLHHFLMTFIYSLQGLLGYLLMFLAMAYSMELVLSTVLGLVVGNLCLIRYEYPKASSRRVDYVPPPGPASTAASTTLATAAQTSSNCPEREPLLACSSNRG